MTTKISFIMKIIFVFVISYYNFIIIIPIYMIVITIMIIMTHDYHN